MTGAANGKTAAPAQANPQFYKQPVAVNRERHGGKSLRDAGYAFAAGANAVALNAVEMAHAARSYPVVFATSAPAFPIAVLGLRENENLFVNADGSWRGGAYVPAYLRRYPFIFAQTPGSNQLTLCVDEAAPHLVDGSDRPLFADGKPTDHTDNALKFCVAFEAEREKTVPFAKALEASGILVENRADVNLSSGEKLHIGGYRIIDQAKFDALPDATILEWRRNGWLAPIYGHFVSLGCWQALLGMVPSRGAKPASG